VYIQELFQTVWQENGCNKIYIYIYMSLLIKIYAYKLNTITKVRTHILEVQRTHFFVGKSDAQRP